MTFQLRAPVALAAATLVALAAPAAHAITPSTPSTPTVYDLNTLAHGSFIGSVGTLSISNTAGGVHFLLTGHFGWLAGNTFLTQLDFDGPTGTVTHFGGTQVAHDPLSFGGFTNAGFHFDWKESFPTSNRPGSDRFLANDTFSFDILGAGLTKNSFSLPMVHLQGLTNYGGSIKVVAAPVPSVPEPGTYALLLAGLGAVGFMVRRRQQG
jgi:hypothetical protein